MAKIPQNIKVNTFIYTLEDPDTNEVRYIGKTVKDLNKRLSDHLYSCKKERNYRTNWIKSIINKGKKPIIKMIDSCPWDESQVLESYWISYYKDNGYRLINLTDGGEGNLGLKMTQKMKDILSLASSKILYQYDLEGNFIQKFKNAVEAIKHLKLDKHPSKINAAARGNRKKAYDFMWSYIKIDKMDKYTRKWRQSQK